MRRGTAWAAKAAGGSLLLCACAWAAAAQAAAPSAPGRFTITRTLADGRTETRSVTLDVLKAMSRPAAPRPAPTLAPDTVVFALPAPIPDPVAPAAPRVVAAAAVPVAPPPVAAPPVAPLPAVVAPAPTQTIVTRRALAQAPSAAAIQSATAGRGGALRQPLALSGGWTLLNKDDLTRDDADEPDVDGPVRLGAPATSKKRKGGKTQLGVRDGKSFGEQGRFYLYAGVKNRGVGLNLTDHNGDAAGGWGSDGVSYDKGGFAGQRSAGVGWRQGDVSTSLGWVHEKNNIKGMYGAPAEKDDRVALTFSWRPSVRTAGR